jgi:hypothetical protein
MQTDNDDGSPFPEPLVIEITNVLDLHTIPPREGKLVIEEYLRDAHARNLLLVHRSRHGHWRATTDCSRNLARTPLLLA